MTTLQIPSKYTELLTGKYTVLMLLDAVYHNGVIHNEYIAFKDEAELKQHFPGSLFITIPSKEFLAVFQELSEGRAAINF
jgi:hypothetical protein